MSATVVAALLLLGTGALFLLPLWPGLREIWLRRDADSLTVRADSRMDIRYFARSFRQRLLSQLQPDLERNRERRTESECRFFGERAVVVPAADLFELSLEEARRGRCERVVVSAHDLTVADGLDFATEIYAGGTLHGGARCRYRAALAEGDVHLGPGSVTWRWIHAGGSLSLQPDCTLHGRASAEAAILVHGPCTFERMRAPEIVVGRRDFDDGWREGRETVEPLDPRALPGFRDLRAGRALIDRDAHIPENSLLDVDLVVWGKLRVGKGTRCRGRLKSHGDLVLEDGVQVDGGVVSQRALAIGRGCKVQGPVIAEGHAAIDTRCQLGRALQPTTLRAPTLELRLGSVLHGSVWASERGSVRP